MIIVALTCLVCGVITSALLIIEIVQDVRAMEQELADFDARSGNQA